MTTTLSSPCDAIASEAHSVFQLFCQSRNRRGIPRITATDIAEITGLRHAEVRDLIDELVDLGIGEFTGGHFYLNSEPCRCLPVAGAGLAGARSGMPVTSRSHQPMVGSYNPASIEAEVLADGPSGRAARRRLPKEAGGIPEKGRWNARRLAYYLDERVNYKFFSIVVGGVNKEAVSSQIARWIRQDGISPDTIKEMIDLFVSTPANLTKGVPAWKSFISKRQSLLEQVRRVGDETERKQRSRDNDYWTGKRP